MNGHVPFLEALVPGRLTIHRSGAENLGYVITNGFLEASGSRDDYHVIVLADEALEVGDIDPPRRSVWFSRSARRKRTSTSAPRPRCAPPWPARRWAATELHSETGSFAQGAEVSVEYLVLPAWGQFPSGVGA